MKLPFLAIWTHGLPGFLITASSLRVQELVEVRSRKVDSVWELRTNNRFLFFRSFLSKPTAGENFWVQALELTPQQRRECAVLGYFFIALNAQMFWIWREGLHFGVFDDRILKAQQNLNLHCHWEVFTRMLTGMNKQCRRQSSSTPKQETSWERLRSMIEIVESSKCIYRLCRFSSYSVHW